MVILATLVVCISSGVILRIFLDGIGHDPLKYPYCASPVAVIRCSALAEWTPDNYLRHSRFIALRDDKKPLDVRRK